MAEGSNNPEIGLSKSDHLQQKITPEQRQSLNSLKNLYHYDSHIKDLIQSSTLAYTDIGYGDPSVFKETLINTLDQISTSFGHLSQNMSDLDLPGDIVFNKSQLIFNSVSEKLPNDFSQLKEIHERYFSYMRPEITKEISTKISGYYMFKDIDFSEILNKTQSFSELLHLAHSRVLADEDLFSKLPKWDSASKPLEYDAYGEESKPAKKIFSYIKEQSQTVIDNQSPIQIPEILHLLSVDNTIQLMVRDFGHALTIEIDTSRSKSALIKYNVPKVFDGTKANQLPGVDKVIPNQGATGKFESSYEDLAKNIFDFILKVPTDKNH